jgi:hypothetical protein
MHPRSPRLSLIAMCSLAWVLSACGGSGGTEPVADTVVANAPATGTTSTAPASGTAGVSSGAGSGDGTVGTAGTTGTVAGTGSGTDPGTTTPPTTPEVTPPVTPPFTPPVTPPAPPPCPTTATSNFGYACNLASTLTGTVTWQITGAPIGMRVQPKSGSLRWSPLAAQAGDYTLQATASNGSQTQTFNWTLAVSAGAADPTGIHMAPNGSDTNDGSAARPFKTLLKAARSVAPGQTIYVRGGIYTNDEYGQDWATRTKSNIAQLNTPGRADAPIVLRPLGNEYVKFVSDVGGLVVSGAHHWTIKGLEIEGPKNTLSLQVAMDNWWADTGGRISGRGIANKDATPGDHLTIEDCIVHGFPGAGITSGTAEFVTVRNNIVYDNAWWSTGGVHGISISSPTTAAGNAGVETVVYEGNLVFGNQSLVISHVFDKGFVTLDIDEGNGMHLQDTARVFSGVARVSDNVAFYNGKGGLGVNTMDRVRMTRNAFFANARTVDTAELVIQSSTFDSVVNNLFQPRDSAYTVNDSSRAYTNVGDNLSTWTVRDDTRTYPSVLRRQSPVFADPAAFDFNAAAGVPAGMGVAPSHLLRMKASLTEYGIVPVQPTQVVDETYIDAQRRTIFATWPASMSSLRLDARVQGVVYRYTYAQRCQYPQPPSNTPCP